MPLRALQTCDVEDLDCHFWLIDKGIRRTNSTLLDASKLLFIGGQVYAKIVLDDFEHSMSDGFPSDCDRSAY